MIDAEWVKTDERPSPVLLDDLTWGSGGGSAHNPYCTRAKPRCHFRGLFHSSKSDPSIVRESLRCRRRGIMRSKGRRQPREDKTQPSPCVRNKTQCARIRHERVNGNHEGRFENNYGRPMRRPTINDCARSLTFGTREARSPRTPDKVRFRLPERSGCSLVLSLRLWSVRAGSAAALVQELIQFGAILRGAEALQKFLEFAFLVFKAAQGFRTVLIERTIVA